MAILLIVPFMVLDPLLDALVAGEDAVYQSGLVLRAFAAPARR